MEKLKEMMKSLIDINDEEWEIAKSIFQFKNFKKGELIIYPNEICKNNYYILNGIVRSYVYNEEGKEHTLALHVNTEKDYFDPFFGDFVSYTTQSIGEVTSEAVSDCRVAFASFKDIEVFYDTNIMWMKFGKIMAENYIVKLVESKRWSMLNATERFSYIEKYKPIYLDILPDYQLASLIGITPQSLSRIKKDISNSNF